MPNNGVRKMFEVRPGLWLVACRACPERPHRDQRRTLPSARACHDWWRRHEQTDTHRLYAAPLTEEEKPAAYLVDRLFGPRPMSRWARKREGIFTTRGIESRGGVVPPFSPGEKVP